MNLKKFIIGFSVTSSILLLSITALASRDISVMLNGKNIHFEVKPQMINNRVMVPLRAICDALNVSVSWNQDLGEITINSVDTTSKLYIGKTESVVIKDGVTETKYIESPPIISDSVTLVPTRYIAETFNASVNWEEKTNTVIINTEDKTPENETKEKIKLSLNGLNIETGQKISDLKTNIGEPNRIDKSMYGLDWYIYNSDYSKFLMVAVSNDIICGFYTNSKGFSINDNLTYDSTKTTNDKNIKLYYDKLNGNKIHAVLVVLENSKKEIDTTSKDFLEIQSYENFDATNAFRVNNGITPLNWDESAQKAAILHSQDMADNNYFSHTSLDSREPLDRYLAINNVNWKSFGENISAGRNFGIDTFDGWLNSEGHRKNMLNSNHKYLGVGSAYNGNSEYKYYFTQSFVTY